MNDTCFPDNGTFTYGGRYIGPLIFPNVSRGT